MSKYVREIDSIQALRDTPTSDAAAAHVRTPTGQSGVFVPMDADPFGRGDDGATALQASDGTWWVRKKAASGGPINVKWYGAKGDGASNDTDSIQKAIDKNPEGVVHFPKGVFVIEKSIDINQFGGAIKGEGPEESVITSESPVLIDCFVFSESSDTPRTSGTTIKDIQIKGSRTNEPWEARGSEGISDAITGFNVQNINIKNVKIRNIEGHGVLFLGGRSKWSQNIKVESCTFIRTASHCV